MTQETKPSVEEWESLFNYKFTKESTWPGETEPVLNTENPMGIRMFIKDILSQTREQTVRETIAEVKRVLRCGECGGTGTISTHLHPHPCYQCGSTGMVDDASLDDLLQTIVK